MPETTLFERARNYVAKMPAAVSGSGGHDATFHVACVLLQGFDLLRMEAKELMLEYNQRCDPPWSDRELEHKLNQADKMSGLETREGMKPRGCLAGDFERDDRPREGGTPSRAGSVPLPVETPAKAEFSPEALKKFAERWRGLIDTAWLADRSPVEIFNTDGYLPPADYLAHLYREGEKVVVFTNQHSQGQALWPLQAVPVRGDEGVWCLAQPVDGKEHINPRSKKDNGEEKLSRRSEESVTSWRFLILESDKADPRDWMAALVQLPLPIAAIYTSGGRSIHAKVQINAPTKQEWDNIVKQLRPILVTLGADPKAMSAVRLTRLPGCFRGEKLQKPLYLNPRPSTIPLTLAPRLRDVLASWTSAAKAILSFPTDEPFADEDWQTIERVMSGLRWFESAPAAREYLTQLTDWRAALEQR